MKILIHILTLPIILQRTISARRYTNIPRKTPGTLFLFPFGATRSKDGLLLTVAAPLMQSPAALARNVIYESNVWNTILAVRSVADQQLI